MQVKSSSERFKNHLRKQGVSLTRSNWFFGKCPENGKESKKYFRDVYERYCLQHLPTISLSSRTVKKRRLDRFVQPLLDIRIQDISSELINEFVIFSKFLHFEENRHNKWNFDKQLKDLRSVFTFHSTMDSKFYNPIKKNHFQLGVLRELPYRERKIELTELQKFIQKVKQPYLDIVKLQLGTACRIGEIAGIQKKNIDLESKRLFIKEVLVWIKGKPHVKDRPKNGEVKVSHINEIMEKVIRKRLQLSPPESPFLFTNKRGEPMTYNQIQEAYNRAWKNSGLFPKFSGTHQLRYASAQLSRKLGGSLEAAIAMTGHKSSSLADRYSAYDNFELNREVSNKLSSVIDFDTESAS